MSFDGRQAELEFLEVFQMANSFRFSKARKASKRVNDLDSHGRSASITVHMFNYDLPVEASGLRETVGWCFAAFPPDQAVRDWSQVTCQACLMKKRNREKSRSGGYRGA
jgi:hypothetical protein